MSIRFIETERSPRLPYLMHGIGVGHEQEPIRRSHGFPQYQWLQVCSGEASVETVCGTYRAHPGDGFFLRANEFHAYHSALRDVPLILHWTTFEGSGVEEALESGPLNESAVYRLATPGTVLDWFDATWEASATPALPPWRLLSTRIYELLMLLAEAVAPQGASGTGDDIPRLLPLIKILETRLAEAWTIPAMAAILEISPQHLGRLFTRSLGQSPLEYLVNLRMNRARSLLVERPQLRIHEVADAVGYRDANLFIRRFRTRSGLTPGAFRRLHR